MKSALVMIGDNREAVQKADILGCNNMDISMNYLGMPLGTKFKEIATWDPVVRRVESRLASRKRWLLSKGGRLTLKKSTLASIPIYLIFLSMIPSNAAKRLEKMQCNLLWGDSA